MKKIGRWIRKLLSLYWKGIQESGGSLSTVRQDGQKLREFQQPRDAPVERDQDSYDS